jgi:hypothetical protein
MKPGVQLATSPTGGNRLLLNSYRRLFWPFLLFTLYLSAGPWVVGTIIQGSYGAIFAWGALVGGHTVPVQVRLCSLAWVFLTLCVMYRVSKEKLQVQKNAIKQQISICYQ